MKRIVLIDANPDNRLLVCSILEGKYDVAEYADGISALYAMTQLRPDLILLDISLPGIDGLEVLQRIHSRELLKNIPVIALTAHAMFGDKERFLAAGFDDYLAKPIVNEDDLLLRIARQLVHGDHVA